MDNLLRSLILPGSEAYARWVSSAYQQRYNGPQEFSVAQVRRDSLLDGSRSFAAQQQRNYSTISNEDPEEGEINEAVPIDRDLLRTLLPEDSNSVEANGALPNSLTERHVECGKSSPGQKLCFFWYHYGECDRDPATPTTKTSSRPCPPHLHSLDGGHRSVKTIRKFHKFSCGPELCPLKDLEGMPMENYQQSIDRRAAAKQQKQSLLCVKLPVLNDFSTPNQHKKRRAPTKHIDEPAPDPWKRQKISYDDDAEPSEEAGHRDLTCFFWYHGDCPRSRNPRTNYQCEFKHALSDPPSMVAAPPGYIHIKSCGLEWCAGDADNTILNQQIAAKDDTSCQTGAEGGSQLQDQRHQQGKKSKSKAKRKAAKQTCFFWCHGTCRRGSGQGEKPCSTRHEMSVPPKMVEPPPGYVHREACEREWCPGDWKPETEGGECDKRYFENEGFEGDESGDDGDGEELQWYLTGFE